MSIIQISLFTTLCRMSLSVSATRAIFLVERADTPDGAGAGAAAKLTTDSLAGNEPGEQPQTFHPPFRTSFAGKLSRNGKRTVRDRKKRIGPEKKRFGSEKKGSGIKKHRVGVEKERVEGRKKKS